MELAGRQLKVGLVNPEARTDVPAAAMALPLGGPTGIVNELDDEGGGLGLNAATRAMLMAKLQRSVLPITSTASLPGLAHMAMPGALPGVPGLASPLTTPAILQAAPPLSAAAVPAAAAASPSSPASPCFVLRNMFDPAT